jgi:transcriptional regulator with XRE-family HTH domain
VLDGGATYAISAAPKRCGGAAALPSRWAHAAVEPLAALDLATTHGGTRAIPESCTNRPRLPSARGTFALDASGSGAIIESKLQLLHLGSLMTDGDDQLQAFGEFVRAQRRLAQVSQRNLARMSGVSDSYLSQIERGNYRPSPQVVKALATAFNLEPKQLYTMLGFMDEGEGGAAPSVEQAIQLDTHLDGEQKEALMRIYRSFVGKG